MNSSYPAGSRNIMADAISYWERRRIIYNVLLTAVVAIWVLASWPHFAPAFAWKPALALFVLALLANLGYCAAYAVDLPMQYSSFRETWLRWRGSLFLAGMLFALLLTNYWIADEIYPYVPHV